jgi:hypothetical protein
MHNTLHICTTCEGAVGWRGRMWRWGVEEDARDRAFGWVCVLTWLIRIDLFSGVGLPNGKDTACILLM